MGHCVREQTQERWIGEARQKAENLSGRAARSSRAHRRRIYPPCGQSRFATSERGVVTRFAALYHPALTSNGTSRRTKQASHERKPSPRGRTTTQDPIEDPKGEERDAPSLLVRAARVDVREHGEDLAAGREPVFRAGPRLQVRHAVAVAILVLVVFGEVARGGGGGDGDGDVLGGADEPLRDVHGALRGCRGHRAASWGCWRHGAWAILGFVGAWNISRLGKLDFAEWTVRVAASRKTMKR